MPAGPVLGEGTGFLPAVVLRLGLQGEPPWVTRPRQVRFEPTTLPPVHFWDPHFFYQPHHRRGVVTGSFDVYLGPGADVGHEWRDHRSSYCVGPMLGIDSNGRVTAGGQHLLGVYSIVWAARWNRSKCCR